MSKPHIVLLAKGTPHWIGGREYTRNLVRSLLMLPQIERSAFDLSLMAGSEEIQQYEGFRPYLKCLGDLDQMQAPYGVVNRVRWKARRLLSPVFNPRLQELLCAMGTTFAYPLLTADAAVQPFRSAEWIPDFQYKHHPEGSNPSEIEGRKAAFAHITSKAGTVVLSSAHAEKDCHEIFPESRGKTFVLRFRVFAEEEQWASNPMLTVVKYHLPERYLLCSNLLAPTKNHMLVLDALRLLKLRGILITVVFTGDLHDVRNPGFYNQFLARIHENDVSDCVRILGLIPKAHQFDLMRASLAVVQPSLFEGWHTGVEEAQLAGKLLVLSKIDVHLEQNPPDRVLFDPTSAEALAEAMDCAWNVGKTFSREIENGARARYRLCQRAFAHDLLTLAGCRTA